MGKVKSGARKPPAKPKQRRKRQIDAEHETSSPSGVDTRHALLTAISTRGCALRFATCGSGWILRRLTRKFNDPKVQDFKLCRGEAFRDYFTGRKTQKVKNHGEPKLTVNGDLFQRKTTK